MTEQKMKNENGDNKFVYFYNDGSVIHSNAPSETALMVAPIAIQIKNGQPKVIKDNGRLTMEKGAGTEKYHGNQI